MKQCLTPEDLLELTDSQRDRLRDLWQPQKFDLALAAICTNAETDEYHFEEFVIGDLLLDVSACGTRANLYLRNLRYMGPGVSQPDFADSNEDNAEFDACPDEEAVILQDDPSGDGGYQFESYNKEDCLPLLGIGQMIELLQKMDFANRYFYLTIPSIGFETFSLGRDECAADYEGEELCDALWECLKARL